MENNERNLLNGLFIFCRSLGDVSTFTILLDGPQIDDVGVFVYGLNEKGRQIESKSLRLPSNLKQFLVDITLMTNEDRIKYIEGEPKSALGGDDYSNYSYNEVIFFIHPKEKKLELKTKASYNDGGWEIEKFKTPKEFLEVLIENDSEYFKLNFWGRENDYEFDFSYVKGDNILPGDVRSIGQNTFADLVTRYFTRNWYLGDGSVGMFIVKRNMTTIDLEMYDYHIDWSGFKKTYILN
jgi:hypothetical protein